MKRVLTVFFATMLVGQALAVGGPKKMASMMSNIRYEVSPKVLQPDGNGNVDVELRVTFPANFFYPRAEVEITPVLKYNNKEKEFDYIIGVQGEGIQGNRSICSFKNGGTFSTKSSIRYEDEMRSSKLYVRAKIKAGNNEITCPDVEVANFGHPALVQETTTVNNENSFTEKQTILKSKPPHLDIVKSTVQFIDKSGNNAIDANESCKIRFDVENTGQGAGVDCKATISVIAGSNKDLKFTPIKLSNIAPGRKQQIEMPIVAGQNINTGMVTLQIKIVEPNGFDSDPVQLTVNTKAFEAPLVQVVDYTVTGSNGTTIAKREEFNLQLLVQNTKYGTAENVNVRIELPANVFMMSGEQQTSFSIFKAGEQQLLSYSFIVNNNYSSTEIPIKVLMTEKYGKYAESKTITLKMNQTLASNALVINEKSQQRQQIQIGALGSDIDKDIPQTTSKNNKTFAVIIANENYQQVAEVPYARNDGEIFRQYCVKTLGIPERNIHFSTNATLNNIKADVRWLKQVIDAYGGEARVIFYYAGHGIPDEAQKTAYLLPIDGFGNDVSTGYKLDDLYSTLGDLPSKSVTVFLDACFSGANRDGQMLASARGVAIKAKSSAPVGNMVVFSAAQGDETAYPNNEQQHGMFTYYLLKKIKETEGNVTYKDLGDYVTDNVRRQSIVVNGKSQTPVVVPSATIGGNWESWKLK